MSGNIVSLNGKPSGEREAVQICVDTLRDLLQRAVSGELVGIGLAGLHDNGEASYHVAGRVGGFAMHGALDMVRAELVDINRGYEE